MRANQYTRGIDWHRKVYMALQAGIPTRTLAHNLTVDVSTINKSYIKHFSLFNSEKASVNLGSKQEPYFTELQMLQGYDVNAVEFSQSELELL